MHQKPHPSPSTGIAKVYGGCRLNRKTHFPPPVIHEKSRPRQRREGGTCKAKFRLTIWPDGRRLVERLGEGHSHTLEEIDRVKRNSGVRGLVLDGFFKSWEAGGILAYLRDTAAALAATSSASGEGNGNGDGTSIAAGTDILKDAGGLYLSRQEVQNILNGALKKAYPGQDVAEVKRQMDKYKNYATCNFKGCAAPAFPDIKALMEHRRSVHGLKSHDHSDKMYACPDKTCWRRKKSKGFATLLGLEEHVREKHNGQVGGLPISDGAVAWENNQNGGSSSNGGGNSSAQILGLGLDAELPPPMEEQHTQVDTGLLEPLMTNHILPLNFNTSNSPSLASSHSYLPLLSDPITPESSNEDSHSHGLGRDQNKNLTQNRATETHAKEASRVLSYAEKESMKIRIKRLMIEREKLDAEIRRLNRAVWGDEMGEGEGDVDGG